MPLLIPQKISERASATTITGDEFIPLIQGGADRKVAVSALLAWGNITDKSSVWTSANSNLSTVDWTAKNLILSGSNPLIKGNGAFSFVNLANSAFQHIYANEGHFSSTVSATTAILSNLTAGYLPYHTAGGLVNSRIWTDGTNVGIGTGTEIGGLVNLYKAGGSQIRIQGSSAVADENSILFGAGSSVFKSGIFAKSINNWYQQDLYFATDSAEDNGNVQLSDAKMVIKWNGNIYIPNGGLHVGGESDAGDNNLLVDGAITALGPVQLKGYTVATLPAGVQGMTAFVTDALAPTFLTTLVGGGAIITTAFFNGTSWIAQ